MKPSAVILLIAVLGLTACTDQPVESEPAPTSTVTETVTAEPADQLPSEDELTEAIATVMGVSDATQLPQGAAALDEFSAVLAAGVDHDDDAGETRDPGTCPVAFETQPDVAAYGLAAAQNEDTAGAQDDTTGLAALGFESVEHATALTVEVQDFAEACEGYEMQSLTHHTDAAFQIRVSPADEPSTSVVLVRNSTWVYAVASTSDTDVALALTLIDQLEESLR